jgi:hypothetical protein
MVVQCFELLFRTKTYSFQEIKADFETNLEDFELFWYSKPINTLRSLLSLVTKLTFFIKKEF